MTQALASKASAAASIEQVIIDGDLSRLSPEQRVAYYLKVCDSLGLNPYTKPFDYLKLSGREILYARKDATDQLRDKRGVSVTQLERQRLDDLYVVIAYATDRHGRSDSSIGAVNVKGLTGENLANALMKAETKAKRRVTLSICGLGMTDDSEVDSIPGAQRIQVDLPPAQSVNQESGEAEIEENEYDLAIQRWVNATEMATKRHILYKDLPDNPSLTMILRWSERLEQLILEADNKGAAA